MRRFVLLFLIVFAAVDAGAGLVYRFESSTTGVSTSSITGAVKVDGQNVRMDVVKGDGAIFKDRGVILSRDGGRTLRVADLDAGTYYDVSIDDLAGEAAGLLRDLGSTITFTLQNPKVSVRDLGPAQKLEGFTTRRTLVETSHDLLINALGQKMTIRIATRNEVWTTNQLEGSLAGFLQMQGVRTGVPAIDAILESQGGKVTGFPLRQIATVKIIQNGHETTSTTTVSLRDVLKRNLAPVDFTLPPSLKKVAR
jgi:hypothetical protein